MHLQKLLLVSSPEHRIGTNECQKTSRTEQLIEKEREGRRVVGSAGAVHRGGDGEEVRSETDQFQHDQTSFLLISSSLLGLSSLSSMGVCASTEKSLLKVDRTSVVFVAGEDWKVKSFYTDWHSYISCCSIFSSESGVVQVKCFIADAESETRAHFTVSLASRLSGFGTSAV